MGRLLTVLLLLVFTGMTPGSARADQAKYIAGIEDLPLMPGLKQSVLPPLDFKHPLATITGKTGINASGPITPQQVTEYYAETLPKQGWVKVTPVEYRRGNDDLDVSVRSSHMSGAMVHFELLSKE